MDQPQQSRGKNQRHSRSTDKRHVRYFDKPLPDASPNKRDKPEKFAKPQEERKTFDGTSDFVPFDEEPQQQVARPSKQNKASKREQSRPEKRANDDAPLLSTNGETEVDPFEGPAEIPKAALKKFDRGRGIYLLHWSLDCLIASPY